MAVSGKDGFTILGSSRGTIVQDRGQVQGTHGYLPQDPKIHTGFIVSGYGVQPGIKLRLVKMLDVAPTDANVVGVKVLLAEGKVWNS